MTEYGVDDLVVLALDSTADGDGSATTVELSETIAFGESLADRVQLLTTLASLARADLVEESVDERDRTRYRLTDAGRDRAAELRAELAAERVTVSDGTDERECALTDVRDVAGISIAEALVRRSPSGELVLADAFDAVVNREDEFDRLTTTFDAVTATAVDTRSTHSDTRSTDSDTASDATEPASDATDTASDATEPASDATWSTADADTPRTVVVTGDAGVGKTTLVEAFLDRVRDRCGAVYVGRSRPGGDAPFEPIAAALDADDASPPAFDVDAALETPDAEAYRAHRTRLYDDIASWLETRAADGPVVLVVEDLQWADSATLDLLAHLHSSLGEGILLLCTYRSDDVDETDPLAERVPADAVRPVALPLESFDRQTTATLVEHELRQRGVPTAFTDAVYAVTGGNPLFVVETVAAALEDGSLDPRVDRYPTSTTTLSAPDVVETTIRRRFDRLDPETRELVDTAALADEPFAVETLGSLCSLPPAQLGDRVDLLVDAGIWRETDGGYRFRSHVLRSGAQSALEPDARRERHRAIAAHLADVEDPNHARIATHLDRAGDAATALEHYRLAAEDAEETYAHDVASSHYERALSIARELDRDDDVLALLESLGDGYYTRGEFDEADRYFRYVREAADDPERIRRSYYYQARMHFEQSEYERTATLARRGLDAGGDEVTEMVCWLVDYLGSAHMKRSDHDAAIEQFERQRELAESIDFRLSLGRSYQNLATVSRRTGAIEDAVAYGERAVALLETASADRELARCLNDVALVYRSAGRTEDYVEALERCHDLAEETGNVRARILAKNNLGVAAQSRGDWGDARSYYEDVVALAELTEDTDTVALSLWNQSIVDVALGDLPGAIDGFERALSLVEGSAEIQKVTHFHTNVSRAYLLAGDVDAARWHVATGQRLAVEHDLPHLRATSAINAATIERERGAIDVALEHLRSARSEFDSTEDVRTETALLDQFARTYVAAGEPSTALEYARRAHDAAPDGTRQATLRAAVTLGAALRAAGRRTDARDHLESTLADAQTISRQSTIRARRELARLERDLGNADRAREHYATGIDLARSAGMTLYVTQLSHESSRLDENAAVADDR
ncbi:ATP-binding protein [Halovivax cerinus]|uniref:ATP-binding protein n=1 Tax=Halovivax cerinus TaxID=1487865 RepID=A0ABD5NPK1_9EURY|nr:tetratricopeptide repeat protein [Halovivax cerinus]